MLAQTEDRNSLQEKIVWEHPFIAVTTKQVSLPDGQVIMDRPSINTQDYVNALILNDADEALIIEGYSHGTNECSWQVVGSYLEKGEDPYKAVQRELLEAGYSCNEWLYLGSYMLDTDGHMGVGHFFYATGAQRIAEPSQNGLAPFPLKWVSIKDLKYALVDGRVGVIHYAANIALALLLLEKKIQLPL